MQDQEELFEKIYSAYEEDNLTFFIGAGVSKTVRGTRARLWNDLADDMNKILGTNISDPLVLAQMLYLKEPEKYKMITKSAIDNQEISDVHRLIAKLRPKTIITTNWDCLLEKALEYSFYDVIVCDKELLSSRRERKLIKMHGDFKHRNIVFKEDDYLNYSKKFPLIENFVKTKLYTSNVIFIGYSYNDINLKYIMNWLRNINKKSNILYVMTDFGDYSIRNEYYENWKIKTYFCNDTTFPEYAKNLEDDKLHRTYGLYNFLNKIDNYNLKINCIHILKKIKLYNSMSYIPSFLVEDVFSTSIDYNNYEKIMDLYITDEYRMKLYDILNYPDGCKEIYDFFRKSKINIIRICNLSNIQSDKLENEVESYENLHDYENDINKYIKIDTGNYYEGYLFINSIRIVKDYISRNEYVNAILEMFKMSTYRNCIEEGNMRQSIFSLKFPENLYEILPKNIIKEYQALIDILSFKFLSDRTSLIIREIEEMLTNVIKIKDKRKDSLKFRKKDMLRIYSEMIDVIYFSKINKICIEYYDEVRKYFFNCIKYIFLNLLNSYIYKKEARDFSIGISRVYIFVIIQYLQEYDLRVIMDILTNDVRKNILHIKQNDIKWIIDCLLVNEINNMNHRYKEILINWGCRERVDIIVALLSYVSKINQKYIISVIELMYNNVNIIYGNSIGNGLLLFCKRWKGKLGIYNNLIDELISINYKKW